MNKRLCPNRHLVAASLVLSLFQLTGCQKSGGDAVIVQTPQAQATATSVPQVQLTPGLVKAGLGLDTIALGQSKTQVEKALGKPEDVDSNEFAPGQTYSLYYAKGIELTFASDKLEVITLHSPDAKWKAYTGGTKEGLGVGSSEEEIFKALGEPAADAPRAMRYPKLGLWFRLDTERGASNPAPRAETLQVMKPE